MALTKVNEIFPIHFTILEALVQLDKLVVPEEEDFERVAAVAMENLQKRGVISDSFDFVEFYRLVNVVVS